MSFYTEYNPTYVNRAAFTTILGLAIGTGTAIFAATTRTSTVSALGLGALGLLGAAVSTAAMTAYKSDHSTSVENYFEEVKNQSMVTIPGYAQFVSQTAFKGMVDGGYDLIRNFFRNLGNGNNRPNHRW